SSHSAGLFALNLDTFLQASTNTVADLSAHVSLATSSQGSLNLGVNVTPTKSTIVQVQTGVESNGQHAIVGVTLGTQLGGTTIPFPVAAVSGPGILNTPQLVPIANNTAGVIRASFGPAGNLIPVLTGSNANPLRILLFSGASQ